MERRHPPDVLGLHDAQAFHVPCPLGAQEPFPVLLGRKPERLRILAPDGDDARNDGGGGLAQLPLDPGALRDAAGVEEGVAGVRLGDAAGSVGDVSERCHACILALDAQVVVGLQGDGTLPVRDVEDAGAPDGGVLRAPVQGDAVVYHQLRARHG